jgi:hypothetical protein
MRFHKRWICSQLLGIIPVRLPSEGAAVVSRDCLKRFVTANRIRQFSFKNSDFDRCNIIVLHERRRPKDGDWQAQLANVVLNLPIG